MLPEQLKNVIKELKSEEWIQTLANNAELYVVGGIVRDAYLKKESKDVDIIVDGLSVNGILKKLKPFGRASLEGESFSVIKFKPIGWEGEDYDIAVPRIDRKIGKGHKGFEVVTDGVSVKDDLKRRDFTINSMAVDIMTGELLDPFNGLKDLKDGKLRATDKTVFIEDPLRILRGIQFAARFGFDIEEETLKLMQQNAHLVKEIAGERIHTELEKILKKGGDTQIAIDLLQKTGIISELFEADPLIKQLDAYSDPLMSYKEILKNLDNISFYYILGLLVRVNPYVLYMKRLRGDAKMGENIKALDNIILKWHQLDIEDQKYLVMKTLNKTPDIKDSVIIPGEMEMIISAMEEGNIPMLPSDIPISGDDIQEIFNIPPSKKIGDVLEQIHKDALMNKFNWKDRESTLRYAKSLTTS